MLLKMLGKFMGIFKWFKIYPTDVDGSFKFDITFKL